MKTAPKPTTCVRFNERELYLLSIGFGTSFIADADEKDPDILELQKISAKLGRALMRFE